MREIVESVLKAEEEARARIDEARKKAAGIREEADRAAAELVASARESAVRVSKNRLDEARAAAASLLNQTREESEASARAAEGSSSLAVSSLVNDIVALIAGQVIPVAGAVKTR